MSSRAEPPDSAQVESQQHAVTLYDGDDELVAAVAAFVADGLVQGERVLLVLTQALRTSVEQRLARQGADVAGATASGELRTLDAHATLATFFADGALDEAAFAAGVGGELASATAGGRSLRAFGVMVNLLWDAGHARQSLRLEALWNELARTYPLTVHCAYSTSSLEAHPHLPELDELGRLHSLLEPPRSYTHAPPDGLATASVDAASRAFVATTAAVRAARRWVEATLRAWGEEALVPDAVLVTSELATNAVRHASSAFRARLDRDGTTVRLSFEDLAREQPAVRDVSLDATGGRGVAIVEQTSARWGLQTTPDGKIVWAEFVSRAA